MGHIVTYTLNAGNVLPSLLGFANINMIINFKGAGELGRGRWKDSEKLPIFQNYYRTCGASRGQEATASPSALVFPPTASLYYSVIVVHFCMYLWLVGNIVLGIIAKKSSCFVSWRQLQSWPNQLCLQSPENELFCFRFLYKMPTKKLISLLLKTASILPCPPPTPPVSRRQKMSFLFLQVFLSWISFSRLRRAIIWYGRPVLHTCVELTSLWFWIKYLLSFVFSPQWRGCTKLFFYNCR